MATTTQPAHTEAPQQGSLLRAALVIFVGLSLITGVLYPVVVTGIGKAAFPAQAGGSNFGPSNPALTDAAKARIAALKEADPTNTAPIPADLVTASASGLDPHISPAAAAYQVERVARARHLPVEAVKKLVAEHTTAPVLGMFGEPVVNVLELNLGLDGLK
ncbi:potassium-transporting ATPase subunit C [Ralstonia syzygii subsp. celebesensis]|uniref:Potassium-transporting ATPase subunit C n=2 Tax=Ralstonia syzygii subsp. celebesensis TaxID=1310168 RepID=A0A1U9VHW2_9RALS|nr:potassium-transporting ATPase subunit C [Ralstonia syzygii]AQW30166.1 potassium-transporting ATPase subunit C [blood disease bacterium A2-HR MARDI]QQV56004.1 potassium-transporting ATPase subunit C [Ralstonia syzygii subsp. celebesensis]CCA80674.1 p-type ATPase, high-affinity potassium transport system, C chain [blood disease bacterium R229]